MQMYRRALKPRETSTPAGIARPEGSGEGADFSEIWLPRSRRSIQLKPDRVGNKNTPLHPVLNVLHGKILGNDNVGCVCVSAKQDDIITRQFD